MCCFSGTCVSCCRVQVWHSNFLFRYIPIQPYTSYSGRHPPPTVAALRLALLSCGMHTALPFLTITQLEAHLRLQYSRSGLCWNFQGQRAQSPAAAGRNGYLTEGQLNDYTFPLGTGGPPQPQDGVENEDEDQDEGDEGVSGMLSAGAPPHSLASRSLQTSARSEPGGASRLRGEPDTFQASSKCVL